MTEETRSFLRAVPSLIGDPPPWDLNALPPQPEALFADWLTHAVECGVPEPQTMTLSTVDSNGLPDGRILVLKDVDKRGWAFASTRSSVKSIHIRDQPQAALTFWWQPAVRSVRVRGSVVEASADESLADLNARSESAREGVEPDDWVLWRLRPSRVEFWQGSTDRRHTRVVYVRDDFDWRLER